MQIRLFVQSWAVVINFPCEIVRDTYLFLPDKEILYSEVMRQLRLFENVQGSNPRLGSEALTRAGKGRGWREQKNFG